MITNWNRMSSSTKSGFRFLYRHLRRLGTPFLNEGKPCSRELARERIQIGVNMVIDLKKQRANLPKDFNTNDLD